jgi:hypothetical protein
MKNITNLAMVFFATSILFFVGCSGDFSIVPVSGKVTLNGKPVDGIRLVFTPIPNDANTNPGPWSSGVSNSEGEYTLATRYKKKGASVGKHTVTFVYDDADFLAGFQQQLAAAREYDGSKAEIDEIKKAIADFKARQQGRSKTTADYTAYVEVPSGGTKEANFELPK